MNGCIVNALAIFDLEWSFNILSNSVVDLKIKVINIAAPVTR